MKSIDIKPVLQIVREAGELALRYEGENCQMGYKSDGTLVTDGDKLVGEFLTRRIQELFPDHLIVQEETADPKIHTPEKIGQGYVWVIDPIDGTRSFREALHSWGILVGLLHNGKPIEGIAFYPRLQEMYFTADGKTFMDYRQTKRVITVSDQRDYKKDSHYKGGPAISVSPTQHRRFNFSEFPGRIFVLTGAYAFALVARGVCKCLLVPPGPDLTDLVSGVAIVEKAGGEFRYLSGEPFQVSDLFHLSSNDKDIIVCPEGSFETVAKYFVPRS